jgi:hypothetical protein
VDAAYRSLRVFWWTRWRLQWSARSDRRAGLPVGLTAHTTPIIRGLVARRDDVCERERAAYTAAVEPIEVRLAEIAAELPALHRNLEQRTREAAERARPLPAERLAVRRAGEENLSELLVRQRRETEHRRVADAARAAQEQTQRQLDATLAEHAHRVAQRQHQADLARSRVLRFGEHTDRLIAIYRRALSRRHPQRDELVRSWQTEPIAPPPWVTAEDVVPSTRETGVLA